MRTSREGASDPNRNAQLEPINAKADELPAETICDALHAGTVGINPIIYAETSLAFADTDTLDRHLDTLMLARLPTPWEAAFLAGRAFLRHRRAGGARMSPLPDF
ncbi:MAG: hypothetical protein OXU81_16715 [Gammaproteobacteria bacterium]|nr:hypothetical protein [Gammaproteobacteria bacterium]